MPRLRHVLAIAVATGLLAGFLELIGHGIRSALLHEFLFLGADVLWTAPLVNAVLFLGLGLAWWMAARFWPRMTSAALVGAGLFLGTFGMLYIFPQIHRVAALVLALGVGVQAGRLAGALGEARLAQLTRRALPVLAATVLLLFGVVRGREALAARAARAALGPAGRRAPHVLLLVLDTVRSFNLSLYGYGRPTSPALDTFAAGGTTFDRAFATAPWTLPSHASMFTGRWPHELSADWLVPLDPAVPTLAEVLAREGYYTAGFSGNLNYVTREVGLGRGFVQFEDFVLSPGLLLRNSSLVRVVSRNRTLRRFIGEDDALGRKSASDLNRSLGHFLDHRPADRPFFAFVNFYDAHRPYLPPPPYDRMFVPPGTAPDPRLQRTAKRGDADRVEKTTWAVNAYDGGLAWLDSQLGLLFADLARRGLLDSTLVIITSDHGEEFGEHGLFDHGNSLYRQALQVPLVLRLPGAVPAGMRVAAPVSLRDLPRTVLALVDPPAAGTFPGQSLTRHFGDPALPQDSLLAAVRKAIRQPDFYPASQGNLLSLVDDSLRYIRNLGTGEERLYDFVRDPEERHDLTPDPAAAALLPGLRARMAPMHFVP